jgi:predicted N-acetyltransferase YhbS
MTIALRPLSSEDSLDELTALLHAAYAQLLQLGFNYTAVDQSNEVTQRRIAQGECCVAVSENRIVGTILFCRAARGCAWYEQPHVAAIHQLAVHPSFQRNKIGDALIAWGQAKAITTGASELALDTAEGATHLVSWYQRLGFRQVATEQWPGKSYRSTIMSKAL